MDAQKEEFSRREDAFRRREEALRKKDLELQESLIKFNKFLQENESKRNRAIKRASDERKQREQKEAEIGRLHQQLAQKMEDEKALKKQVAQNMKYQVRRLWRGEGWRRARPPGARQALARGRCVGRRTRQRAGRVRRRERRRRARRPES